MGNHQSRRSRSRKSNTSITESEINFVHQPSPLHHSSSSSSSPEERKSNHESDQSIADLASPEGVQVKALSLDSLKLVTECLVDMNMEVVNVTAECKDDIRSNKDLFELVEEYFESSLATLEFCSALEVKIKEIRNKHVRDVMIIKKKNGLQASDEGKQMKPLEEFVKFKGTTEDVFALDLVKSLEANYRKQISLLDRLKVRKKKLEKKFSLIRIGRRVTNVLFGAAFAGVLICSVVTALVVGGPVASAVAAATAIPVMSVGKYFDTLWKKYENVLEGQKEIIGTMNIGTSIVIKNLDALCVCMDRLPFELNSLFGVEEEKEEGDGDVAVKMVAEEVRKRLEAFEKNMDVFEDLVAKSTEEIKKARSVLIQRIIKHPDPDN